MALLGPVLCWALARFVSERLVFASLKCAGSFPAVSSYGLGGLGRGLIGRHVYGKPARKIAGHRAGLNGEPRKWGASSSIHSAKFFCGNGDALSLRLAWAVAQRGPTK
jgi:hypothetical protein